MTTIFEIKFKKNFDIVKKKFEFVVEFIKTKNDVVIRDVAKFIIINKTIIKTIINFLKIRLIQFC